MALEAERRARSEADQELLVLRGRLMGSEEANARLCTQVTRQAEELSTLENSRAGTSPFIFCCVGFFLQPIPEPVAPPLELVGKVKTLEQDLETTKVTLSQNAEELAKSHEERRALEGDLDQICNIAQLVVSKVFRSVPSTSAPAVQLAEVSDVVKDLVRSRLFYRALGVLTSVAT